jgi:NAD(P)-dependent dehydrogenase (short-subunit alcohol dehydrogenase family)
VCGWVCVVCIHTLTHSRPTSPSFVFSLRAQSGHFVLVNGLVDLLLASAPARVVHVSSDAQHHGYESGLRGAGDLASINDPVDAVSFKNYGQAKLCNTLFSNALNRRYGDKGL